MPDQVANFNIQPSSLSLPKQPINKTLLFVGLSIGTAVLITVTVLLITTPTNKKINWLSPLANDISDSIKNFATIPNPLTGTLFKKDSEPPWIANRPLGVMINNHPDARPQSGLISADLVYEMVAEGGITRYLAFFLSQTPAKIGPVRSIREYYLILVKETADAEIMHIGYSPQALAAIESWPVRSLARGGADFWRDNPNNVAIEHTAYVNGVDLRSLGIELGWEGVHSDFEKWAFKDRPGLYSANPDAKNITVDFWYKGDFSVNWKYKAATNSYLRFLGYDSNGNPIPHLDRETKAQITATNIIVQFATEISIPNDEKHRLDYTLIGSGKALVFTDGKKIDATWSKADRDARTKFYDLNGNELKFNRGNFWVDIVPDRNIDQVTYN